MSAIHVTPGGAAADALREALARTGRRERVIELCDDLAIGPLRGADDIPNIRAAFWRHVLDDSNIDFTKELDQEASHLKELVRSDAPIVIWHAQSAANQLLLRRVAYHLYNEPQRINEVRLSLDDLPAASRLKLRCDGFATVNMFDAATLEAKLANVAPISVLRISRLALEWQEVKQINAETRRWRDNTFKSGSYAELDTILIEHITEEWRPAARIVADLMIADVGFLVSDTVALWRCREAAAAGRIKLRNAPRAKRSWNTVELRANTSAAKPITLRAAITTTHHGSHPNL